MCITILLLLMRYYMPGATLGHFWSGSLSSELESIFFYLDLCQVSGSVNVASIEKLA